MNRITDRLAIFSFVVTLFGAGCAVEQASESSEEATEQQDSDMIAAGGGFAGSDVGVPGSLAWARNARKQTESACLGCGPLPDPWMMGPLPDPWTSSSGGSSSSTSSSSSSSSSSGGGGNGDPAKKDGVK